MGFSGSQRGRHQRTGEGSRRPRPIGRRGPRRRRAAARLHILRRAQPDAERAARFGDSRVVGRRVDIGRHVVAGPGGKAIWIQARGRVYVRLSTGTGFAPAQDWTGGGFYGNRGTYFADVDGNGRADAIVVDDTGVTARRSNGARFQPNEDWSHSAYYGSIGNSLYFADVTGDGCQDALVINPDRATVRRVR